MVIVLALLSQLATAAPASFETASRWHITSDVRLPAVLWLGADRNKEARITAWQLNMVLDCEGAGDSGRASDVRCSISDLAVHAAPLSPDAEILPAILDEVDDLLTGAAVVMRFGQDGTLRNLGLKGPTKRHRRHGAMAENLRLMVSRAVAGLDLLAVPDEATGAVKQKGGWILQMPAAAGTLVGGGQLHQVTRQEDAWTQFTQGEATLQPYAGRQWPVTGPLAVHNHDNPLPMGYWGLWSPRVGVDGHFHTQLKAVATLDPESGALRSRTWTALGEPTPDSRMTLGAKGYTYMQQGSLTRLEGDVRVDLGESEALPPLDEEPSALQTWETLGVTW